MKFTMKLLKILFPRSGTTWLFGWTGIYAVVAFYSVFVEPVTDIMFIQFAWIFICNMPLWIPPLARFLRMKPLWK